MVAFQLALDKPQMLRGVPIVSSRPEVVVPQTTKEHLAVNRVSLRSEGPLKPKSKLHHPGTAKPALESDGAVAPPPRRHSRADLVARGAGRHLDVRSGASRAATPTLRAYSARAHTRLPPNRYACALLQEWPEVCRGGGGNRPGSEVWQNSAVASTIWNCSSCSRRKSAGASGIAARQEVHDLAGGGRSVPAPRTRLRFSSDESSPGSSECHFVDGLLERGDRWRVRTARAATERGPPRPVIASPTREELPDEVAHIARQPTLRRNGGSPQ